MANERTIDLQIDVQDSVSVKGAEAWAVGQRNGVDVGQGDPTYHNNSKYYAEVAGNHAAGATRSEEAAEAAKQAADADALKAEGYAVGKQNGQDVGSDSPYYHRNTFYYCEESAASKDAAARSEEGAAAEALKAEGFAQGKQAGQDVGSDSPYYHANGAYYKDQAAGSAEAASGSAGNAAAEALKAEGYAQGKQAGQDVGSDSPYYHANGAYYKDQAAGSAEAASGSAGNAAADALKSEGYAVGKQGGQAVGSDSPYYQNNAEYYKGQAAGSAEAASGSAGNAAADALKSEGYALGKQNGQAVVSGSPYYQNNADYYRGQAAGSATNASNSADAAAANALKAEGYADGKQNGTAVGSGSPYYHNNGKYYLEQTEAVAQSIPEDYSELSSDVSSLKSAMLLEAETIPDTVQAIAFDSSGNVSSITHSRSGSAVRTDAFTFGANTITEVRTLSSGESLTIVTNIDTLETTVTFAAAA